MELRGNYIRKYETATERDADRWSGDYYEPWVSATVENGEVDYNKDEYERLLGTPLTFVIESDGDIKWVTTNANNKVTLEYSKNEGETWAQVTSDVWASAPVISVASGETVMLRCANDTASTANNNFSGTSCGFSLRGNIMSLLKKEGFATLTRLPTSSTFTNFFKACSGLSDASELLLPATALTEFCYNGMFYDCVNLEEGPESLPGVMQKYCYGNMFRGCVSLTKGPLSLAGEIAPQQSCEHMFNGCTSLTKAPELPATILENSCYSNMFNGCSSLTEAPELPATTVKRGSYQNMFKDCSGLTQVPSVLPATDLSDAGYCYLGMFQGCKSLTKAPLLPATLLHDECYSNMFNGCTALVDVQAALPAEILKFRCYLAMFYNCSSMTRAPEIMATAITGTVCCQSMFVNCYSLVTPPSKLMPAELSGSCYASMFSGCRSLTSAPQMLFTTAAANCCDTMFYGCVSLTTPPDLPATTLASKCYYRMFWNCTGLTAATELPATTLAANCYESMFQGCASLTDASMVSIGDSSTVAEDSCCKSMFNGCANLTQPPTLPATTLAPNCYYGMFYNVRNHLVTAPVLPAATLATNCYRDMFNQCYALTGITCLATDISATDCTTNWVQRITTTGTFSKAPSMTGWTTGDNGVPANWTVQDAS